MDQSRNSDQLRAVLPIKLIGVRTIQLIDYSQLRAQSIGVVAISLERSRLGGRQVGLQWPEFSDV